MANYLVLSTICGPGDHLICQYPTYGQLYTVPRLQGAEVDLWKMIPEEGWKSNFEALATLIRPNTKAIIINNPNNPTGVVLPKEALDRIVALAAKQKLTIFSDEVFSPLFHTSRPAPPPFVSLGYLHSVSTGSVSKAHGLPGIRVGWVVSPDAAILQRVMTARDYTTISVSQLDDGVAAFALSPEILPRLLERNLAICRTSIDLMSDFITRSAGRCEWIAPEGSGTAFIRVLDRNGKPVDDAELSTRLVNEVGVAILPGGHCFSDEGSGDFRGYVRISLGEHVRLREGLEVFTTFLEESL